MLEDYRARLERDSGTIDPAVVWSTLRTITNYKKKSPVITPSPDWLTISTPSTQLLSNIQTVFDFDCRS